MGLGHLREEAWLMSSLLYGSGPRLMECVKLRVKGMDADRLQLTVRDGEGSRGRVPVLPQSPAEPTRAATGEGEGAPRGGLARGVRARLPPLRARQEVDHGRPGVMRDEVGSDAG